MSTVVPITACVRGRSVVWPRGVNTILGININNSPVPVSNYWYQYMQTDYWDREWTNWAGDYNANHWFGNASIETRGSTPCFNPILSEGFSLRTFITNPADVGKQITFYGTDVYGQTIFSTRTDGTIQTGVQVAMVKPYVDTPIAIRHVTRVVKEETNGEVRVYQYNIAGGFMLDFGLYQPTETSPEYIQTTLRGLSSAYNQPSSNGCRASVSALVKLAFVPFKFDDDLVQVDCLDAIRDMVFSIRQKDSGNISASAAYEVSAIRELNYQMRARYPDEQFQVDFRPFGRDRLDGPQVRVGML